MRLFFSGDIPDEQRALLAKIQEGLKPALADVKWVQPINLHITLRFIGEVSKKVLPRLEIIGHEVGKLYGSFDLSLKGLGTFPPKGPPRVLWAGIDEGKTQMSMVAQAIDSRLSKLNIKMEEHEFKPHITLGRLRVPKLSEELLAKIATEDFISPAWHFDFFLLKESQLAQSGPVYKNVFSFRLAPKIRVIQETKAERWSHHASTPTP